MNISQDLQVVALLGQLYPMAIVFAKNIEAEVPALAGSQKFQSVEAAIAKAATNIEADATVVAHVLPIVGAFVNGLVAMYNASGVFTKASAAINRVGSAVATGVATVANLSADTKAIQPVEGQ